jgi:competence protein ComEA
MALRTRSATSGPGRSPGSDSRARHGRPRHGRIRTSTLPGGSRSPAAHSRVGGRDGSPPTSTPTLTPPSAPPSAPHLAPTLPRRRADALFAAVPVREPAPALAAEGDGQGEGDEPGRGPKGENAGAGPAPRRRGWRAGQAALERLPMWVQLRCGLEPRTLGALAVVLVVAVVLAVQHFWTARPQSVRAPGTVRAGAAAPAGATGDGAPGGVPGTLPETLVSKPSPSAAAARVVVDVGGKVGRPGVVRLAAGSRVADALRAAGGVEPGADLTGLNRARLLVDGEQVLVDSPAPPGGPAALGGPAPPAMGRTGVGGIGVGADTGAAAGAGGIVSLNSATPDQLDTLPGVGPVLAQHIIDYRTQHGGFRSVDELREVKGIGDGRFADLQPLVRT